MPHQLLQLLGDVVSPVAAGGSDAPQAVPAMEQVAQYSSLVWGTWWERHVVLCDPRSPHAALLEPRLCMSSMQSLRVTLQGTVRSLHRICLLPLARPCWTGHAQPCWTGHAICQALNPGPARAGAVGAGARDAAGRDRRGIDAGPGVVRRPHPYESTLTLNSNCAGGWPGGRGAAGGGRHELGRVGPAARCQLRAGARRRGLR